MKGLTQRFSAIFVFAMAAALLVSLVSFRFASAHTDPVGCSATGVGLSLSVFRNDGTTPIGAGTVTVGETIKYQATLSYLGLPNCNYQGGTLNIKTPNNVVTDVTPGGGIPLISSGSPFTSSQVSYVVSAADANPSFKLNASTTYANGTAHLGGDVTPVGATTPIETKMATGKIIIEKQTNPDGSSQSFNFTAGYDNDGFSLTDGQQNDSGKILAGTYAVSEATTTGWVLDSATCSDGSPVNAIVLGDYETVTCVFTNSQQGKIIVQKQTIPALDPQSFTFTADYDNDGFTLSDGQQNDSGNLNPGTYAVSEATTTNWVIQSKTCSDGSDPAAINLAAGETVTCTFVNKFVEPNNPPDQFATRTQGFWQTHTAISQGVLSGMGGSMTVGNKNVNSDSKLFAAFYSSIPKLSVGGKRTSLDQARMIMVQQLVAAKLNCAAFGCSAATQTLISNADAALIGTNEGTIKTLSGQLDAYNGSGDSMSITLSGKATPKDSKDLAQGGLVFWDSF